MTRLRCGRIFNYRFITSFLDSVLVKEFLKSVNIWRYELEYGVYTFYWLTVYTMYNSMHL